MKTIEVVFKSCSLSRKIEEAHNNLATESAPAIQAATPSNSDPNLLSFLAAAFVWAPGMNLSMLPTIYKMLDDVITPDFASLHLWAKPRQILESRLKYVRALKAAGLGSILYEEQPRAEKLEAASLLTFQPNQALAIKVMWLYKGLLGYHFYGNAAYTGPVKKFFKIFFRLNSPDQPVINRRTFAIAEELDEDPLYVNTAMWIICS